MTPDGFRPVMEFGIYGRIAALQVFTPPVELFMLKAALYSTGKCMSDLSEILLSRILRRTHYFC
jgi:hypothetical protein